MKITNKPRIVKNSRNPSTSNEIRLVLIDRYLNGYSMCDTRYANIIHELWNLIQNKIETKSLLACLKPILGEYNQITAAIYHEIAYKYLLKNKYKYKKRPTLAEIYTILTNN